jgi:hypothetical protein
MLSLPIIKNRPKYPFPGTWFLLPTGQHLHLVQNASGTFRRSRKIEPRDCHFAIRVHDWQKAQEYLRVKKQKLLVDPFLLKLPQLYLLDPDRHVIEITSFEIGGFMPEV